MKTKEQEYTMGYDITVKVHLKGVHTETVRLEQSSAEHIKDWFIGDLENAGVDVENVEVEKVSFWKEQEG